MKYSKDKADCLNIKRNTYSKVWPEMVKSFVESVKKGFVVDFVELKVSFFGRCHMDCCFL